MKRSRLLTRGMASSNFSIAGTPLSNRFFSTAARSLLSELADKARRRCSIFFASGPLYEFHIMYRPSTRSTTATKAAIVKMGKKLFARSSFMLSSLSFVAVGRVEHRIRQIDPLIAQLVRKFWADAGGLE